MKSLKLAILLIAILGVSASAQYKFPTYYQVAENMYAPAGAFKYGLYNYSNPAFLNTVVAPDFLLTYSGNTKYDQNKQFGAYFASPFSGFSYNYLNDGNKTIHEYSYATAFGTPSFGMGVGFSFFGKNKSYFDMSNYWSFGAYSRPNEYISLAAQFKTATANKFQEGVAEIAVRPIKNYLLTLFADAQIYNGQKIKDAAYSYGVSYEFLKGIRASGRYFSSKNATLGLDISFGDWGVGTVANINSDSKYSRSTYMLRSGALDRAPFKMPSFEAPNAFLRLDLSGSISYVPKSSFSSGWTLLSILNYLDKVINEKEIGGVVINASQISASREMLWEIREKLKEVKANGKKVIIFVENANIDIYHFASVADELVIDELGGVSMEGYMLQASYYKKLLEKLGIGFEELRYFKYKSAVEAFAREKMSDADREQRQKIVDDWFAISKNDICESRHISSQSYDSIIAGNFYYSFADMKKMRLADFGGRWHDLDNVMREIIGRDARFINPILLEDKPTPIDDHWGEPQKEIAIIYAIGACDMESGIKARKLVKDLEWAYKNDNVKAIILRVDSPGGDAMASDYIAEVMRKNKNKKPVFVSQGMVAGSGGYWLSMYGDKIIAAPGTITGSIGVISGRIYDKGMKDSLGIGSDMVKAGKFADLNQAFSLPIIPIGLPVRNYSSEEKAMVEQTIRGMYKDFVTKVADGRKMKYEDVEKIAQGRIWSGLDGKKNGLVDEIGGLDYTIKLAKKAANIKDDEYVIFAEYPKPVFFDLDDLLSSLMGARISSAILSPKALQNVETYDYLNFRINNNSKAMPVMPMGYEDLCPKQ